MISRTISACCTDMPVIRISWLVVKTGSIKAPGPKGAHFNNWSGKNPLPVSTIYPAVPVPVFNKKKKPTSKTEKNASPISPCFIKMFFFRYHPAKITTANAAMLNGGYE